jgi:hypothetical protein
MRGFIPYIRLCKPVFFTQSFFTMHCIAITFSLCALTTSLDAKEDYYTWVDENGITNYAERNPQGYKARHVSTIRRFGEQVAPKAGKTSKIPDSPRGTSEGTTEANPDYAIAKERALLAAEIASEKKSNCRIGKNNLAKLEMFSRVRISDEKGQNRTLSPEEKSLKEDDARNIIRENCPG